MVANWAYLSTYQLIGNQITYYTMQTIFRLVRTSSSGELFEWISVLRYSASYEDSSALAVCESARRMVSQL
jgi:hypothetical protein